MTSTGRSLTSGEDFPGGLSATEMPVCAQKLARNDRSCGFSHPIPSRLSHSQSIASATRRSIVSLQHTRPRLPRGPRAPLVGVAREPDCRRGAGPTCGSWKGGSKRDWGEETRDPSMKMWNLGANENVEPEGEEGAPPRRQAQSDDRSGRKTGPLTQTPGQFRPEGRANARPRATVIGNLGFSEA